MSVLVVGAHGDIGADLVRRLVSERDEVRVVESDPDRAGTWTGLGAYVASGVEDDPDLLERAATNVRTAVVIDRAGLDLAEVVAAVVESSRLAAGVPEEGIRVVLCSPDPSPAAVGVVVSSGLQHVVLRTGTRRTRILPGREELPVSALVEAIDAADDLAGDVRLDLDLTDPRAWAELRADPPQA